jgi:hypothetical protein
MASAKSLFLERIASLVASTRIDAITNRSLTERSHNDVARILRNGLAVVGFASLEDFIKSRISEVLNEVGRTGVPFRSLPEKLRFAATFESVSALSYQMQIREKSDRVAYIQEHAAKISSTSASAYEITPHAFGYDQANVNSDTIKSILKSFLVDDPWGEMSKIAARIGLVGMPLDETFRSAATRRHRAAHVAHHDTPQTDIQQYTKEAYAIAITFDALLTKALKNLYSQNARYLSGQEKISSLSIKIRSLRMQNNIWKELIEGSSRAVKADANLSAIQIVAKSRAIAAGNLYIEYNQEGEISNWECN